MLGPLDRGPVRAARAGIRNSEKSAS